MEKFLRQNVFIRSGLLWIGFMLATWAAFGLGWATHPQAWNSASHLTPETGWHVFGFILGRNLLLVGLIAAGNLLVRFGGMTPGLAILAYQAVAIGWTAGANQFMEPFPTVAAANLAFLRIGLWETSAYVLVCAATLPKSLLAAATFPAKEWKETRRLADLRFNLAEALTIGLGFVSLFFAAFSEAFLFWT